MTVMLAVMCWIRGSSKEIGRGRDARARQVRRRFRHCLDRPVGNWIASITALMGDATDLARSAGSATSGWSPSHQVGSNNADATEAQREETGQTVPTHHGVRTVACLEQSLPWRSMSSWRWSSSSAACATSASRAVLRAVGGSRSPRSGPYKASLTRARGAGLEFVLGLLDEVEFGPAAAPATPYCVLRPSG